MKRERENLREEREKRKRYISKKARSRCRRVTRKN